MTLMVISPQADVSMDSTALDLVREMSGGCNAQVNPKLNGCHSKTTRPPGSITNLGNPQKSYQSQYAHMILSLRRFRVHEAAIVGCLDCHKSASFDASEIKRVLADEVPGLARCNRGSG